MLATNKESRLRGDGCSGEETLVDASGGFFRITDGIAIFTSGFDDEIFDIFLGVWLVNIHEVESFAGLIAFGSVFDFFLDLVTEPADEGFFRMADGDGVGR